MLTRILSLFLAFSFLSLGPAQAGLSCSEIFEFKSPQTEGFVDLRTAQKPQSRTQRFLTWLQNMMRFGRPDFKSADFEIWIAENKDHRPLYNRKELTRIVSEKMTELVTSLRAKGFEFRYPLRIVIENTENSIAVLPIGSKREKSEWEDYTAGASVYGAQWVGIRAKTNQVRTLESWREKWSLVGSDSLAILFTRVNRFFHFIESPFVVAHEIAHVTENPLSHNSRYWIEARADLIAYVLTGISDLLIPGGVGVEVLTGDHQLVVENEVISRSLKNPTVPSVSQIIPRYMQYHKNSQPISAALYDMTQIVGQKKVLQMIQWIDSRKFPHTPDRTQFDDIDKGHFIGKSIAETIQHDLRETGQVLERAIETMQFPPDTQRQLLQILERRGLLIGS